MSDELDPAVGNAADDGAGETRGWFVGHFITPSNGLRHTEAIEVKWGVHPADETRASVATGLKATTLSILVSGAFRVVFHDREVLLSPPGDYVLFPAGVPHAWVADADSVVLTVRWPSGPGASTVAEAGY